MNQFKKILLGLHGENKSLLRNLYVDRQVYISSLSSSEQPVEDEKIYTYHDLRFRFIGTGMRHSERMNLLIFIPEKIIATDSDFKIPCEDFLLRSLSPLIREASEELENDHRDSREKARFEVQETNECILRRSGLIYDQKTESYVLRILFFMPLFNGVAVNAKSGFKAVRHILEVAEEGIRKLNYGAFAEQIKTYGHQEELREWLTQNHCVAFVADGSILPRQGETEEPMKGAVLFYSPEDLRRTVHFSDGSKVAGMAVPEGITVITGGGYSGKSTLLDALETGIYHHIPGDGREYVVSLPSSTKIYAEDGRPVQEMDLSLFFQNQVTGNDFHRFKTGHASGSVSQAANILEAIYAGCRLLLIDEDTSATNFMIRDSVIRQLVQKEPIIPFTDRVRSIYGQTGISTILVIGGSGEYLQRSDLCLMMEDYRIRNVTARAKQISCDQGVCDFPFEKDCLLQNRRFWKPDMGAAFYISQYVSVDRARYIQIDKYSSDVTRLTALRSQDQLHTLTYLLEHCFLMKMEEPTEYRELAEELIEELFDEKLIDRIQTEEYQFTLWLEEIRPMDLIGAMFRLRRG